MATILPFTPFPSDRKINNYDKTKDVKLLLSRAAAILDEMGEKERRVGWLVSECSALLGVNEDYQVNAEKRESSVMTLRPSS